MTPEQHSLIKRLENPPFGTETSERNLMQSAADAMKASEASIVMVCQREAETCARYDAKLAEIRNEALIEAASAVVLGETVTTIRKRILALRTTDGEST